MVSTIRAYLTPFRAHFRALPGALALAVLCACGGPGPYGYARTYEPLLSEKGHFERAQERPFEEVKRAPYEFKATEIAWFGVVEQLAELPDARTQLTLSFRSHQARHLCDDEYQDSCRVTVSDTSPGHFAARLKLRADEATGKERVWAGSLLKIYGTPTGDYDEHGNPVIEVKFHRHWPRGYFVTTAQRGAMKR